jgi:ribosomal protein S18 acetylase RimI-like enzyme
VGIFRKFLKTIIKRLQYFGGMIMVGFDVRGLKEEDYKDILKLNPNITYINEINSLGDESIIVAQLNDDVIGYIRFEFDGDKAHIEELIVDEMYRNLGVGYQLISEFEKNINTENLNEIIVLGRRFLKEEVEFYNRQGFKLDKNSNLTKKKLLN